MNTRRTGRTIILLTTLVAGMVACRRDPPERPHDPPTSGSCDPYTATPYDINATRPAHFAPMLIPADNPMTVEGIKLGRHLFYEKRLSGDNTMSCAACHAQSIAFTDAARFSTGIDGIQGTRNSMVLQNLGWERRFFWDGRAMTLEQQILDPVPNPIEMHETWPNAAAKLRADPAYVRLFCQAFGTDRVDSIQVSKAIAQFLRTMISGNSKFDRFMVGEIRLDPIEELGFQLTQQEGGPPPAGQGGADCFHCHPHGGGRFTDGLIRNNGLEPEGGWTDLGLGGITRLPQDYGKFKTPSLRNVALSAPYMHDGRFNTLEEVIDHYDSGGHPSSTIDPNMKFTIGGLSLTPQKKQQLLAFLHTLTDLEFVTDERFSDPGPP